MGSLLAVLFVVICAPAVLGQRVAVIAPDETDSSSRAASMIWEGLPEGSRLDPSLVRAAYLAEKPNAPYNMTRNEAIRVAAAIGCDSLLLLRSAVHRRSSSAKPVYYEASAVVYLVSGRTGRLVDWRLLRYDEPTPAEAADRLMAAIRNLASEIAPVWAVVRQRELAEPSPPIIEEVPAAPPGNEHFRAPVPYRRIKPQYTADAAYYDVAATVEITLDLSASGEVLRTEIERWAGYGLDESVENTVRAMNWRPAERNGKPVPMRFLLRYNFADIEKK